MIETHVQECTVSQSQDSAPDAFDTAASLKDKIASMAEKKTQFPGLEEKPYWGRRTPDGEYEYTDRDGELVFAVARFTYPGSIRQDFVPAFFNGAEWVKKVPETFDKCRPLINLVDLYREDGQYLDKEVIIVQDEFHYERLKSFVDQEELPYIVTTWHGSYKGIRKTDYEQGLRHRSVILFPSNEDFSINLFEILKGCVSPYVERLRIVDSQSQPLRWGPIQAVNNCNGDNSKKSFELLLDLLSEAEDVPMEIPGTSVNDKGIGHLETPIPLGFINKMIEEFGELNVKGKKSIPSSYISCMRVIDADPAFKDFLKYDEAVANPIWDTDMYPTIDDLKNAVLRRLSNYGINVPKQTRDDIVMSLSNDPRRKINSVKEYFEFLVSQHPDADESDLDKFMTYITIDSCDSEADALSTGRPYYPFYKDAFRHFFIKSCLRLYTAYSKNPVPNDAVPVFHGAQGIGKTRLCKYLAMDVDKYVDLGNKTDPFGSPNWVRHIIGKFIAELGEMNVMRKTEIEVIKSGISETFDSIVPKFKEGVKSVPRTVNFVGTSNEVQFLKDMSGNRRFFPLEIKAIDHDGLFANSQLIERLWAHYYSMVRDAIGGNDEHGKFIPYKNDPPNNFIRLSEKMDNYFNIVRNNATDLGISGDLVQIAIYKLEKKKYSQNSRDKYIGIDINEVVEEIYGNDKIFLAKDDIKKKCKYWLSRLHYDYDYGSSGGRNYRIYRLVKTNEGLISRVMSGADDLPIAPWEAKQ